MAAKFKVLNQREYSANFVNFENNQKKTLIFSDWTSFKGQDVLFKAYVTKEDGIDVDKVLTIFDFDLAEGLKKIVKKKRPLQKVHVEITMKELDEFNKEFTISEIKD